VEIHVLNVLKKILAGDIVEFALMMKMIMNIYIVIATVIILMILLEHVFIAQIFVIGVLMIKAWVE
jgi:hypothetical protein